jgi:hypothetical protein
MNLHDDEALLVHVVATTWWNGTDQYVYTFYCGKQSVVKGRFTHGSFSGPTCIICIGKSSRD